MTSSKAVDISKELDEKEIYKYLCTPFPRIPHLGGLEVSITRPGSKPLMPNLRHQITGSLDEIHTWYLAVESYLRIESLLTGKPDLSRVSVEPVQKLYQVHVATETQPLLYLHLDSELDAEGECDPADHEKVARLTEKSRQIQKFVTKTDGFYNYYKRFESKSSLGISISKFSKKYANPTIRILTNYFDSSEKPIHERCTDVEYTVIDIQVLRFAILDFLRHNIPILNDWKILRSTKNGEYIIQSRIQRHLY